MLLMRKNGMRATALSACLMAILTAPWALPGEDRVIAKKGSVVSAIVVAENAPPPLKHAAGELAFYLGKISDSPAPAIVNGSSRELYNIYLLTAGEAVKKGVVNAERSSELREDGFILKAGKEGLFIIGRNPRGVLFGAYEILKRYGGIRWLVPGADGEYFTHQSEIRVPDGETLCNPAFPYRTVFLGRCNNNSFLKDTWDWQVRNNLAVHTHSVRFSKEAYDYLEKLDAVCRQGGHIFTPLVVSVYDKDFTLKSLYEKHPEAFPLINGKRVFLDGQKYQPCTTNPMVLERMRRNLVQYVEKRVKPGDYVIIGNNDGTSWCQCENCQKLDPPEEKAKGSYATRYWTLVNDLARTVWEKQPDVKLGGWAYQNFHGVPKGVEPDQRLLVMLTYNNHCFRHALEDVNCPVNREFLKLFREWTAKKNYLTSWEQMDYAAGDSYMFIEKNYIEKLKSYRKLGVKGPLLIAPPPDGVYSRERRVTRTPVTWYAMWNTLYLASRFLWDMERDCDAEFEEANSLYYGRAGGAMKEYHRLLEKAMLETPCCHGWGHNSPIGRCLEKPGVQEKALGLLAKAEKDAAEDPRALKHISFDRKFFTEVWLAERKNYLEGFREIKCYSRKEPIAVDGIDKEEDWKNAERISNFKVFRQGKVSSDASAGTQTFLRIVYEPEFLYFFLEVLEPEMKKIKAEYKEHDSRIWEDNSIEIFINHPDLANKYYHLVFNHKGVLYDSFCNALNRAGDRTFNSEAEIKTRLLADRWCVEMKIPTSGLGMKCFDGTTWKINVARSRILTDGTREHSSLASGGSFHNVDNFLPLVFSGRRIMKNGKAADDSPWKNGSFDNVVSYPASKIKNWKIKDGKGPLFWSLNGDSGAFSMGLHPESKNYYLTLSGGAIYQFYNGGERAFRIRFRASGKGSLAVRLFRYRLSEDGKRTGLPSITLATIQTDSTAWKEFSYSYEKSVSREYCALVFQHVSGEINIDDVIITPTPTL
ncbi:MAG: hypothetical protein BWY31_03128 [Lentisphaerae bacterium ADurb.Bin242]|nr:MAG: hypothetical protein BWY31_03128 [Lentisphaerae bacterium ADurb.Bin242]